MGNTLKSQKDSLEKFLYQWEMATNIRNGPEPAEVHICGDINLDSLNDKWLHPSYHLLSLSKMVVSACNICNLRQLVCEPTRFQYNSVSGVTNSSCIDHVYTNYRFRCSEVKIIPFGNSDHNIVEYTRFSKDPPTPSRIIRKRSYKNFVLSDFLTDLEQVDWLPVYLCADIDPAVDIFTNLINQVLDIHAPWVTYQVRKKFSPWITDTTLALMKQRDLAKNEACKLSRDGKDSSEAWAVFKKLRNKVNNRIKFEEKKYKIEKINDSLETPAKTWITAKGFMNWTSNPCTPLQL